MVKKNQTLSFGSLKCVFPKCTFFGPQSNRLVLVWYLLNSSKAHASCGLDNVTDIVSVTDSVNDNLTDSVRVTDSAIDNVTENVSITDSFSDIRPSISIGPADPCLVVSGNLSC